MGSNLRSRLWWSYMLVTASVLGVVAVVLLVYIAQNPSTYRQASVRMALTAALLRKNETALSSLGRMELQARLEQAGQESNVRIVIYNRRRQVVVDSSATQAGSLHMPLFPRLRFSSALRDQNGKSWLYIIQHLNDGSWLLVAVPRPVVPLSAVLSDEFLVPILVAAIFALIISLFVAFWLSRWIGNPLQRLVTASRQMPSAQTVPIEPGGPQEVQELARAFNEMNDRLLAMQRSQREFVANVSHELKTPLTSIQGFSQAILDGTAITPEAQEQAARVIHDEAGQMHRLVLDLLELARLDAGILELRRATLDLPALLRNVAGKFGPQALAIGVAIHVNAPALPAFSGDGDRLAQVFSNLVDNALKNTPGGGNITLQARIAGPLTKSGNGSEIQVDGFDTGIGIPAEVLPHIFERFYQADPARAGGEKHGTGLGLAIVKEIVGAHGGKMNARSTPNAGSTFTVYLPLTTPNTPSPNRRKNR